MADNYDFAVERDGQTTYYYPNQPPQYEPQPANTNPAPTATGGSAPPHYEWNKTKTVRPTTTTTGPTLNADQQSARAIITDTLNQYGLGALAERAWQMYLEGQPIEQVMLNIRKSPEYAARFPGMAELQKKGRAITEADYINIEQQYVSLFRQAGLPAGFYDSPDDFGRFISNEVSPQEMAGRLDVARVALYETPPQVRDELSRLYGLGSGDVMAFLLDPTKALPVIKQQLIASEAGYAARASGYGLLTRAEAETLGYTARTFDQLTQGFDELARSKELFAPIIGETGETIDRTTQLAAEFGGDTAARRRIEQRAKERVARFQGGGGYATTGEGVSGLGSAAR